MNNKLVQFCFLSSWKGRRKGGLCAGLIDSRGLLAGRSAPPALIKYETNNGAIGLIWSQWQMPTRQWERRRMGRKRDCLLPLAHAEGGHKVPEKGARQLSVVGCSCWTANSSRL